MFRVHVSDDLFLRIDQRLGAGEVGDKIRADKVDDAAEAGDEMGAAHVDAVEAEIREIREHFRLRLPRKVAAARVRIGGRLRRAHKHHPGTFERIAGAALVEHERDTRIGEDVLGMDRQARNQQQRSAVRRRRHVDEGAIRVAGPRHQGRERAGARLAQEGAGGAAGVEIRGRFHSAVLWRILGARASGRLAV